MKRYKNVASLETSFRMVPSTRIHKFLSLDIYVEYCVTWLQLEVSTFQVNLSPYI